MTRYTKNGLRYAVTETGRGAPLILLHGFTGSADGWQPLARRLADRHRLIAIDLPGHGRSDAPRDATRYRMERVAADLAALLLERDAAPADWLGYSMGGRLALYCAIEYPHLVRRLVLESASPGLTGTLEREARVAEDEALAARIERQGVAAFVNYWESLPLFASQARLPEATRAAQRAQRLDNNAQGLANSLRGMGTGVQPPLGPRLPELARPALLVVGELDEKFVAINRRMAAALPDGRLAVAPDAGHAVHLERPAWFSAAVGGFLEAEQALTTGSADFRTPGQEPGQLAKPGRAEDPWR